LRSDNSHFLQRVAAGVFDHPIDRCQLRAFLDDERHILFCAVDGDTVIGMASAFEYFHPDRQPQLFINEVGVAPTHRRQGIGRRLVQELLKTAKQRGCAFAWLGTEIDNEAGQACFGSVVGVAKPQQFLLYEWNLADQPRSG
jgi:aminoglycoside 6'-N-acetyltransferase I